MQMVRPVNGYLFDEIPFDLLLEHVPRGASRVGGGSAFSIQPFGVNCWHQLFNTRQSIAIGTFIKYTREATRTMLDAGYDKEWSTSISSLLALAIDRLADRESTVCSWTVGWDKIRNTFTRFALPYTWYYAESVPIHDSSGGYPGSIDWISRYVEHASRIVPAIASIKNESAIVDRHATYDVILTDLPYYDAIPYSDLMDFFYVWLRRSLFGLSSETDVAFSKPLSPKWNVELQDGELVDDSGRHNGDHRESKKSYEDGMSRAFASCHEALMRDCRLVIVFAHKQPDAWETLVGAIIRSGFVVDASWPIQTEMANRTRALVSAALSSSVWLVCKKLPETARPGWDNRVLEEMRQNIHTRLRDYWDAGIRGPDFVWAAMGPAMEAYSKHPVVKKANEPGKLMEVSEFLSAVRTLVVDFVVGRVLTDGDETSASGLDVMSRPTTSFTVTTSA
jgi:putative DNA methylase